MLAGDADHARGPRVSQLTQAQGKPPVGEDLEIVGFRIGDRHGQGHGI